MTDYPYDLGTYSRPVTTSSSDAQRWFDRGLNWLYGYNHEEASVCFKRCLEHDIDCAMAYWGLAYAIGPNYNRPWERFGEDELSSILRNSRQYLSAARARMRKSTPAEQALINALSMRYQADAPPDDLSLWTDDYAKAMRLVYQTYSGDPDITALYVESMMIRTPWQLWNPRTGQPVEGADTLECRAVLEQGIAARGLAGNSRHPGLLHLYIHLMEMSPVPEVALRVADDLRYLVPDAGHLKHMATHIDVLCGNYQDVVAGNSSGIVADLKYWKHEGAMNFYSLYRVHNYHFKLYGAMFLGQFGEAMDAVQGMRLTIPEALLRVESPPMADYLEGYMSMETHALVRFGKWQALVDAPLPEDPALYSMTTAMTHYGKGIAYAALGRHDKAAEAQDNFLRSCALVTEDRYIHVTGCQQILDIAQQMLAGEIDYHKGSYNSAFEHLRQAVVLEDELPYDEPWGWMMPSRHALGALLLEQGQVEEAADAYESDLGLNDSVIRSNQHPDNVWALLGLHRCYQRLGRQRDARLIKPRLEFALARADKDIRTSCFCSMKNVA